MRLVTTLPLLWSLAGCSTMTALPDEEPDVRGIITAVSAISPPRDELGTIRVEENPAEPSGSDKYVLTITRSTVLLVRRSEGEAPQPIAFDQIRADHRAEAWITGPVRESYPMQATASHVLLHEARTGAAKQ